MPATAASPPARWPNASSCTPTSPATTSRSSPAAATSWSRSPAPAADGSARAAGRPSKHYRAGPLDATLALPLKHDDLLAGLLARALDALGPAQAERLADDVGFEYGVQLAQRIDPTESHRSVRAALSTVADALTAHGFAAHAESSDGRLTIVSECCPFGDTATQYPHVVCALDRGMIRGMLAGLHGETPVGVRDEPARRRRPLRRARLNLPSRDSRRLPRPRVVVTAAARRARRDAPLPARAPRRSGSRAPRGPRHPRRDRGGPRAGRRVVRRAAA